MYQDNDIVVVSAKRTAIGSFCGSLSNISATSLGTEIIKSILHETNIQSDDISEVILGQVLTTAVGQNPARQSAINAGISNIVPACTINQVCGSGLRSVALAYQSLQNNDAKIIIAGGQENMSLAPHSILMRNGLKMGDGKMIDTMLYDGLTDAFSKIHMGITAENLAKRYNITRAMQDEFALLSQQKAAYATQNGFFQNEIIPITVKNKKEDIIFRKDECIRMNLNINDLTKLKTVFQIDGTVTAGNASGINDGAAMILMMHYKTAKHYNLKPMARITSWAHVGVEPEHMGIGPVKAVPKALSKANWKIDEVDLFELNEAFAAQALSVITELEVDHNKTNISGGAIAIGHPIGASGTRILVTLLHNMQRKDVSKGLASLCIGGGMGIALCVERF